MQEATIPMSVPQALSECKAETCHIIGTIHPPLKDTYLSTSPKYLSPTMTFVEKNDHVPNVGIDNIPFIDEEDNENVDLIQRSIY